MNTVTEYVHMYIVHVLPPPPPTPSLLVQSYSTDGAPLMTEYDGLAHSKQEPSKKNKKKQGYFVFSFLLHKCYYQILRKSEVISRQPNKYNLYF